MIFNLACVHRRPIIQSKPIIDIYMDTASQPTYPNIASNMFQKYLVSINVLGMMLFFHVQTQ